MPLREQVGGAPSGLYGLLHVTPLLYGKTHPVHILSVDVKLHVERSSETFVSFDQVQQEGRVLVPVGGLPLEIRPPASGRLPEGGLTGFEFQFLLILDGGVIKLRVFLKHLSFHLGREGEFGGQITQLQGRFSPKVIQGVENGLFLIFQDLAVAVAGRQAPFPVPAGGRLRRLGAHG